MSVSKVPSVVIVSYHIEVKDAMQACRLCILFFVNILNNAVTAIFIYIHSDFQFRQYRKYNDNKLLDYTSNSA